MKSRRVLKPSPRTRKIILVIVGIVATILLVSTLLLPVFAKHYIEKKIEKTEQERQMTISVAHLKIVHLSLLGNCDIHIQSLSIQDNDNPEKFIEVEDVISKIKVWKGFHRTLDIKKFSADNIHVNILRQGERCNYKFLKRSKMAASDDHDYRQSINRLLDEVSDFCPAHLSINNLFIKTQIDSDLVQYRLRDLQIRNGNGSGKATVQELGKAAENWNLSCHFNAKRQQYEGTMVCIDAPDATGSLPFLRDLKQLNVQFHEAKGRFSLEKSNKKQTICTLSGTIHQLECQHRYLADKPVQIDSIAGDLHIQISAKQMEIDSTSTLKLNRAIVHPRFLYAHDKHPRLLFQINEQDRDAEPLFSSLPANLFQILPNMSIQGKMDFNCLIDCDFGQLDSLRFDFNLINRQRSIHICEGLGEITRFNEEFEYTFYDNGIPLRTLWIGPSNPYFCSFNAIPQSLTQAILSSEDGSFFVHHGFIKSSMQQALVADIKAGKMRRGGSTISMQLVKNLFLNRKKVLTRKFEELLLVWLIEDQRLISKERMFEIYVNIIEWGPGIIGIGEAAEFYFHKRPGELTMPECIYLASLIRAPKHYAGSLNDDGSITEAKQTEIEFVADRMVERGFMTEAQRHALDYHVQTVIRSFPSPRQIQGRL